MFRVLSLSLKAERDLRDEDKVLRQEREKALTLKAL